MDIINSEKAKNFFVSKTRSKILSGHYSTIKLEPKSPRKIEKPKKIHIKQISMNPKRKFFNSPELTLIS